MHFLKAKLFINFIITIIILIFNYYLVKPYIIGYIIRDEDLLAKNENFQAPYRNVGLSEARYIFNRFAYILVIFAVIFLRFTVAFAGAEPDYYTVEITNMDKNVDFGDIPLEKISQTNNTITYHVTPE